MSLDGDHDILRLVGAAETTRSAAGTVGGDVSLAVCVDELATTVTRATMPVPAPNSVVSHVVVPSVS